MPSPILKGKTTIQWGPDGALPGRTTVIVESISIEPKGELPEIEDNSGFTATEVILDNGFDATVKCLYDSAITWPAVGDTVSLKRPRDAAAKNCLCVPGGDEISRKKETTITFKLQYRPGVTLT